MTMTRDTDTHFVSIRGCKEGEWALSAFQPKSGPKQQKKEQKDV